MLELLAPSLRFREARFAASSAAADASPDIVIFLVRLGDDRQPCLVDIRNEVNKGGMCGALATELCSISCSISTSLDAIVVFEAKAETPCKKNMMPHINCIHTGRPSRTTNVEPAVVEMVSQATALFVGANFNSALSDVDYAPHDSVKVYRRNVDTAFALMPRRA